MAGLNCVATKAAMYSVGVDSLGDQHVIHLASTDDHAGEYGGYPGCGQDGSVPAQEQCDKA